MKLILSRSSISTSFLLMSLRAFCAKDNIHRLIYFWLQAYNNRLSVGMTPKTLRLPKPGEMLLSVHGSPLGVYKEDNMEAIHGMSLCER